MPAPTLAHILAQASRHTPVGRSEWDDDTDKRRSANKSRWDGRLFTSHMRAVERRLMALLSTLNFAESAYATKCMHRAPHWFIHQFIDVLHDEPKRRKTKTKEEEEEVEKKREKNKSQRRHFAYIWAEKSSSRASHSTNKTQQIFKRASEINRTIEPRKMASQTQGIQQLLTAEKRAAEKVAEARKRNYYRNMKHSFIFIHHFRYRSQCHPFVMCACVTYMYVESLSSCNWLNSSLINEKWNNKNVP